MKITMTYEEVYCSLDELYNNVAKRMNISMIGKMFDCRKIEISKRIQDELFNYYKEEKGCDECQVGMLLCFAGPKANGNLEGFEIIVEDGFISTATYENMDVPEDVKDNVRNYFEDSLPQYVVLDVYHKSNHPEDNYLYMVKAKKNTALTDDYAVWTSWNETTQSLNCGHYNLSEQQANEVIKEYFNDCTVQ